MSLNTIANAVTAATGGAVTAQWDSNTETLTFLNSTPQPMSIADVSGNFTAFTGLNGNRPIGNITSGILGQISGQVSEEQVLEGQTSDALKQLNAAQANIAGVSTSGSTPGVPIANIQQQAMQDLITYNAMLQVLQVIDQMYSDLVSMTGSTGPSNFFQSRG